MNYLTIILRWQFNLFYRAGKTFIPGDFLIPLKDEITPDARKKIVKLFHKVTPFEFDEEYLILHLKGGGSNQPGQFKIEDVKSIYPLSESAKRSIENKIDPRIRLEEAIFSKEVETYYQDAEKGNALETVERIWEMCKFQDTPDDIIQLIGLDTIIAGINDRKSTVKVDLKDLDFWRCLLIYDRYEYFPTTILGNFFDVAQIYSFYKGKADGLRGTKIEEVLNGMIDKDLTFDKILTEVATNEKSKAFNEALLKIGKDKNPNANFSMLITASLFLKWKSELRDTEGSIFDSTIICNGEVSFIKFYPTEVKMALILLAFFFGNKRFYDDYYDFIKLDFYKVDEKNKSIIKEIETIKKVDIIEQIIEDELLIRPSNLKSKELFKVIKEKLGLPKYGKVDFNKKIKDASFKFELKEIIENNKKFEIIQEKTIQKEVKNLL